MLSLLLSNFVNIKEHNCQDVLIKLLPSRLSLPRGGATMTNMLTSYALVKSIRWYLGTYRCETKTVLTNSPMTTRDSVVP